MRAACAAAARVLRDLSSLVVPGVSTAGLDATKIEFTGPISSPRI